MHGTDPPGLPKSVVTRFIKSYNIKLRRVQRKKTVNKLSHLPKLMTWHTTLREGLKKTGSHLPYYDTKWGRFTPERRFNVDQVPVPFAIDSKTTYEVNLSKSEKRDHRVWVANPGLGLDRRQCTLQVCISPESKADIAIIVRGSGKRNSADEIKAYHPDVDVYWQEKAWADTKFSVEWVRQTLKEGTKLLEGKEFVCRIQDEWLEHDDNIDPWLGNYEER